jgi:hypothetical protein
MKKVESPSAEAIGRVLVQIRDRLGVQDLDRVWIFPPLVKGRKEWGLVAVSYRGLGYEQRTIYTARYVAELTGTGVSFESEMASEGTAPADRLSRVMDGVARRSELRLGDPRVVRISGSAAEFSALLQDYPSGTSPGGE